MLERRLTRAYFERVPAWTGHRATYAAGFEGLTLAEHTVMIVNRWESPVVNPVSSFGWCPFHKDNKVAGSIHSCTLSWLCKLELA